MKSIKAKITVVNVLITIIAFLAFAAVMINSQISQVTKQLQVQNSRQLSAVYLTTKTLFNKAKTQTKSFATDAATWDLQNPKSFFHAIEYFRIGGGYDEAYVGLPNGDLIVSAITHSATKVKGKPAYDASQRPWYKNALANPGRVVLSQAYVSATSKLPTVTASCTITQDGRVVGVVGVDVPIIALSTELQDLKVGSSYGFIFDRQSRLLAHPDTNLLLKIQPIFEYINKENTKLGDMHPIDYTWKGGEKKQALCKQYESMTVCITSSVTKAQATTYSIIYQILGLVVIFIIIISFIIYFTLSKNLAPLKAIENGLLAFFDFLGGKVKHSTLIEVRTKDEFGAMAKLLNENINALETQFNQDFALIEEAKCVAANVRQGIYDSTINKSTTNANLEDLKTNVNEMIEGTKAHIHKIDEALREFAGFDYSKELVLNGASKGGGWTY